MKSKILKKLENDERYKINIIQYIKSIINGIKKEKK